MPEDPTTLQLVAENYGLPGMVLFSLVVLIGFLSFGLPRLIHAIRDSGDGGERSRSSSSSETPSPPRTSKGPGHLTQAWTREAVEKAKDDVDERFDLKTAPIKQSLDRIREEIAAGKGRDKEHYTKLDELAKQLARLDKRLTKLETLTKIRHGVGSGLAHIDEDDSEDH